MVSSIERGLCVLVGIAKEDSEEDLDYVVRKLLNTRVFDNPKSKKRWNKSVKDLGLELLCVSQFTLNASLKGNKLDFHHSMSPEEALKFYSIFLQKLRSLYAQENIKDGQFGAYMDVSIENDGPVTLIFDSKNRG